MSIRPAKVADAGAIAGLYVQSAAQHAAVDRVRYRVPALERAVAYYTRLLNGDEKTIFVAESDGEIAGMVEVWLAAEPSPHSMMRPRRTAMLGIAVDAAHRRRGIGSALMAEAAAWAKRQGVEEIVLDMLLANAGAIAFYRALGYEEHGVLLRWPVPPH